MSAYEIAVSQGFVGDVTAWLASLQGTGAEIIDLTAAEYEALTLEEQADLTKIYAILES
jgi:hypothetical protein